MLEIAAVDGLITNGNVLAGLAILCWPVVAIVLYQNLPFSRATIWVVLGAFLLLPSHTAIKINMVPGLDKSSVPGICAAIGCIALGRRSPTKSRVFGLPEVLALLLLFGPLVTSLLNSDPILLGAATIPGVGLYDGISTTLGGFFFFLPFFVGRLFFFREMDLLEVLAALTVAAVIYSVPMLFEIRFSPQLANWIYGSFRQAGFVTEVRYSGYRPVVFLQNGLETSFLCSTAVVASLALWRAKLAIRNLSPGATSAYLGVLVVMCKSAGALVYAIAIGASVRFLKPKTQVRLAILLASLALTYPLLRLANVFPTDTIVSVAAAFNEERASSLKYRFDQEQVLLQHASDRLFFGWGRYGRNRIYSEWASDESTTDGQWIITLGQFGLVGFLAQFGLIALPIFRIAHVWRLISSAREKILAAALSLILAITLVEQLPNASISSWTWLLVGVLLGRAERIAYELPIARRQKKVALQLSG